MVDKPTPNNQSPTVQQSSTFWSGINKNTLQGLYGAGTNIYSGLNSFGKNPIVGGLTLASTYGNLQQAFPGTFTNPQQNPNLQNANYYGGAGSTYAGYGLQGINAFGNFQQGNVAAGLGGLASLYDQSTAQTGLPTLPGYVNGALGGAQLVEGLAKGNYSQAAIGGAQLYNQGVQSGLIGGSPISNGLIGGVAGGLNIVQGLRDKNYAQAGLGVSGLTSVIANNYPTISNAISGVLTPLATQTVAQGGTQIAVQGTTQLAAQGTTQLAAQGGTQVAAQAGTQVAAQGGTQAGAQGAATAGSQTIATVGQVAGAIGAAYGVYSLGKIALSGGSLKTSDTALTTTSGAVSGAGAGAYVGSLFGPGGTTVGAVIGGVVGGAIGFGASATASSKGTYQSIRDNYRELVIGNEKVGLFGKDYKGKLADGTDFDFGKDGDSMKLDASNPLEGRGATLGDILASAQGATGKGRVALATMFAKASASNAKTEADVDKNIAFFAKKLGIDKGVAQATLNQLKVNDKLSDDQYNRFSDIIASSPLEAGDDKGVRKLKPDEIEKVRTINNQQEKFQNEAEDYAKKDKTIEVGKDFQVPGDPNTYQKDKEGKIVRTKETIDEGLGSTVNPDTNMNEKDRVFQGGVKALTPIRGPLVEKGVSIGARAGAFALTGNSNVFGSKDEYQQFRDNGRDFLKKNAILDETYQGTLADGSKFDFGKDGKGQTKLDYDDPVTGRIIGQANLIAAAEGFTGKALEAMSMLYTAAAMSNAKGDEKKASENIKHFAKQRKFDSKTVAQRLASQYQNGEITREEYEAFENENNQTLGPSGVARISETGVLDNGKGIAPNKDPNAVQDSASGNGKGIAPNKDPNAVVASASNGKGIARGVKPSDAINAAAGSSDEDRALVHGILTDNVRTGPLQFTPQQAAALGRVLGINNASYKDLKKVKAK